MVFVGLGVVAQRGVRIHPLRGGVVVRAGRNHPATFFLPGVFFIPVFSLFFLDRDVRAPPVFFVFFFGVLFFALPKFL
ncbi:hypothetical protein D6783_05940 [Candidatus Woesearchaeota archaeon]|nr:MAG: hypothetical protein D6783_05940 [Candidatus Woesearchaeota archaeon]